MTSHPRMRALIAAPRAGSWALQIALQTALRATGQALA